MLKTRYSKQREWVYNTLKMRCDHPTAEDIYADLKKTHPSLSLATVYRNLNILLQENRIHKLQVGDQSIRYDADIHDHFHFICNTCHTIYDMETTSISLFTLPSKHQIIDTDIIFRGICQRCRKN